MVSEGLQRADLAEAARLDQDAVRFHAEDIVAALDGSDVDHLGAKAVSVFFFFLFNLFSGRFSSKPPIVRVPIFLTFGVICFVPTSFRHNLLLFPREVKRRLKASHPRHTQQTVHRPPYVPVVKHLLS